VYPTALYSEKVTTSNTAKRDTAVPIARRVDAFSYAIRNVVVEAQRVEAAGRRVRYLNIGDPNAFGFKTPPHLIEAVAKAMRDDNGAASAVSQCAALTAWAGRPIPLA